MAAPLSAALSISMPQNTPPPDAVSHGTMRSRSVSGIAFPSSSFSKGVSSSSAAAVWLKKITLSPVSGSRARFPVSINALTCVCLLPIASVRLAVIWARCRVRRCMCASSAVTVAPVSSPSSMARAGGRTIITPPADAVSPNAADTAYTAPANKNDAAQNAQTLRHAPLSPRAQNAANPIATPMQTRMGSIPAAGTPNAMQA